MDVYHVLGYIGALLTGLVLGLLGGGGALLSVPTLTGFFGLSAAVATGYSLFLVGVTASSGAVQNIRKYLDGDDVPKQVLIPTALYRKADAEKDPALKR